MALGWRLLFFVSYANIIVQWSPWYLWWSLSEFSFQSRLIRSKLDIIICSAIIYLQPWKIQLWKDEWNLFSYLLEEVYHKLLLVVCFKNREFPQVLYFLPLANCWDFTSDIKYCNFKRDYVLPWSPPWSFS